MSACSSFGGATVTGNESFDILKPGGKKCEIGGNLGFPPFCDSLNKTS